MLVSLDLYFLPESNDIIAAKNVYLFCFLDAEDGSADRTWVYLRCCKHEAFWKARLFVTCV